MIMKELCIESNNRTDNNYSEMIRKCKVFAKKEIIEMNYLYITIKGDVKEVKKAVEILTR